MKLLPLVLLLGCTGAAVVDDTTDHFPDDEDADGYTAEEGDCDDNDRAVNPGAAEVWYDGFDQNCDGADDDDQDGDGSKLSRDCDDTEPEVRPGADELCDGIDNDCDDQIDDNPVDGVPAYGDSDLDGWAADNANEIQVCDAAAPGLATQTGDCDDRDADVAPDALELCNGEDDDCDDAIDEDAVDPDQWWIDADGDGFGVGTEWVVGCTQPLGYASSSEDCDDARADANPDAIELCDLVDNNCDGTVDNDAFDATTVYTDADLDGFGVDGTEATACAFSGAAVGGDCDDANASTYPAAAELCDELDNDCDTEVDEDAFPVDYYVDGDGDGFGAGSLVGTDCIIPAGHATNDADCDDGDAAVSPVAIEMCDGIDNDCVGDPDDGAVDASTWYLDEDADGFGLDDDSVSGCAAAGDHSAIVGGDCDDSDDAAYPGAAELDDLLDQDCDDLADEDFVVAGDLVISEIARQTWMGGASTDTGGQWFEVYNASARDVVLSNWVIARTSAVGTDSFLVEDTAPTLAAGELFVFCASDVFTIDNDANSLLACDYVWTDSGYPDTYEGTYRDNTFHLQRDADGLSLALDGRTVDDVTWDATWPAGATQSMTLDGAALDATSNDDSLNWDMEFDYDWWNDGASSPEYGTPGTF